MLEEPNKTVVNRFYVKYGCMDQLYDHLGIPNRLHIHFLLIQSERFYGCLHHAIDLAPGSISKFFILNLCLHFSEMIVLGILRKSWSLDIG